MLELTFMMYLYTFTVLSSGDHNLLGFDMENIFAPALDDTIPKRYNCAYRELTI